MARRDWAWTVVGLIFGLYLGGFGLLVIVAMLAGFWPLLILIVPLIIAQFVFDASVFAGPRGIRRAFGFAPAKKTSERFGADNPWLRRKSLPIGAITEAALASAGPIYGAIAGRISS